MSCEGKICHVSCMSCTSKKCMSVDNGLNTVSIPIERHTMHHNMVCIDQFIGKNGRMVFKIILRKDNIRMSIYFIHSKKSFVFSVKKYI